MEKIKKSTVLGNVPNRLTVLRILLIPVCCALLAFGRMIPALIVFAIAALTDFLDGYLARKNQLVTVFGKFADPVADKLLVLSAMIFLCEKGLIPAWAVTIVAFRELFVDGLRLVASQKGHVMPAGMLGKIKTNLQLFAVMAAMLDVSQVLTKILVILMAAMTVISGISYFVKMKDVFKE